jgi:putative membrane protein
MELNRFLKQFNWRFLLVRVLVNALALAFTAAVLPKVYFVDTSLGNWLLTAFMLGVLNALLKPLLQFLTLQFIFVTYGLVVVLVNALLLWVLSWLFPARFAVESLLWVMIGGLVLGLVSSFLESLMGLTMPVVPDEPPALRRQLEEQARRASRLTASSLEVAPQSQALAVEPPVPAVSLAGSPAPERYESGSHPQAVKSGASGSLEEPLGEEAELEHPETEPQGDEKEERS